MTQNDEKKKGINILKLSGTSNSNNGQKRKFIDVLTEQIVDSLIVGGISGLSAYISAGETASFKTFFISFALMFLVKMKEYRNI